MFVYIFTRDAFIGPLLVTGSFCAHAGHSKNKKNIWTKSTFVAYLPWLELEHTKLIYI